MNTLIASISGLGATVPLPGSRTFVKAIATAALLLVAYCLTAASFGNDAGAFDTLGAARYVLLAVVALAVVLLLFGGVGLIVRTVFHLNGRAILQRYAANGMGGAMGRRPPAFLDGISRIEFTDGLTVLAWALMALGVIVSIIQGN
ncbi:hypothetical protein [Nitrospirillum amazonense]|uniref:Uncharacterized protein n=1 Tax=Nitrospirillum amazonense TaxID=28077 RepID=A0A560J039_9PROT|nr:hypothetical protein [Nitrospirillum amazonense]MDG3442718.1 hypothetical protein [Nitrospirillum amazonense]TWB64105.1 hypothetical protein FBZ87_1263 [Nitrospirillum amazonense]